MQRSRRDRSQQGAERRGRPSPVEAESSADSPPEPTLPDSPPTSIRSARRAARASEENDSTQSDGGAMSARERARLRRQGQVPDGSAEPAARQRRQAPQPAEEADSDDVRSRRRGRRAEAEHADAQRREPPVRDRATTRRRAAGDSSVAEEGEGLDDNQLTTGRRRRGKRADAGDDDEAPAEGERRAQSARRNRRGASADEEAPSEDDTRARSARQRRRGGSQEVPSGDDVRTRSARERRRARAADGQSEEEGAARQVKEDSEGSRSGKGGWARLRRFSGVRRLEVDRPSGERRSAAAGSEPSTPLTQRRNSLVRRLWRKNPEPETDELPPFDKSSLIEGGADALKLLEKQVTSITVHRTDELPHDHRIAHPLLSVHVIDGFTGRPLRKSDVRRPGVTAHERQGPDVPLPYILPVMTKPFTLRGASMRLPAWEEELLLGEEFLYLLHPRVFLLFELLDFAPEEEDSAGLKQFAWGFLKPVSGPMAEPGRANALRQMPLRLQLYRWQSRVRSTPGQPAVWTQYLAAGRQRYSSTLYVTLRPCPQPGELTVKYPFRPMAPHHREEGRLDFATLQKATTPVLDAETSGGDGRAFTSHATRTARGGGPCLLPNALLHALPGGEMGATAIAISPDGHLIACALAQDDASLLAVYEVLSARRIYFTHAHHRTTHELSWSPNGERLLSVSADGTAKLWQPQPAADSELSADELGEPLVVLPHPTFIFCGRFQPRVATNSRQREAEAMSLVTTGANDHAVRLWDGASGELLATKVQHQARLNSLTWSTDGSQLFTADALGVVRVWAVVARLGAAAGADLKMTTIIEKPEIRGMCINSVTTHPTRRRLLLQTRNSQLLALETRLLHFSARYAGHKCGEYNVRASYSPDGRFVLAGTEDGELYAWLEETGEPVLENFDVGLRGPLLQTAWCSQDHVIAMCAYGERNPILVYYHDPSRAVPGPAMPAPAVPSTPLDADVNGAGASASAAQARSRGDPSGQPQGSENGRTGSAQRRERRSARRGSETDSFRDHARGIQGLRPPPVIPDSPGTVDSEVLSARRKAAAAARRALGGDTKPIIE
ncbi:hypothetical protein AB1Y20_021429 [Prymnesium parvum]|uniref:Uncharacterized protein n=1 Tax=Prymnesium parvum TaxID=97485 RepID=A0AB34JM13_PRYPA